MEFDGSSLIFSFNDKNVQSFLFISDTTVFPGNYYLWYYSTQGLKYKYISTCISRKRTVKNLSRKLCWIIDPFRIVFYILNHSSELFSSRSITLLQMLIKSEMFFFDKAFSLIQSILKEITKCFICLWIVVYLQAYCIAQCFMLKKPES